MRAWARHARWTEEMDITEHEMLWTINSFYYKADTWKIYARLAETAQKPGHRYYANRQTAFWEDIAANALQTFQTVLSDTGHDPALIVRLRNRQGVLPEISTEEDE